MIDNLSILTINHFMRIKTPDRKTFYHLCQLVVDHVVTKDQHVLEYGKDFGPIKAQHISAVIEELRQLGALERIGDTEKYKAVSPIYRLYYSRYFEGLIEDDKKAVRQMCINYALVAIAILSAFFSGISSCR